MINQIVESETGRRTLEIAAEAGYKLGMEFAFGCNGGCGKENKNIVLNPVSQDDVLIGVLIHECRHAGQFERALYEDGALNNGRARTAAFLVWYENEPLRDGFSKQGKNAVVVAGLAKRRGR